MRQGETFNWEPISILFSLGNKGFNGGGFFFKWDILREIFEIQKTVDTLLFSCRLKISFKGLN